MKNIFYPSGLLIILFTLLFSCHKDAEINTLTSGSGKFNDYMPLKVGAKYEYKFNENRIVGLTHNNIDEFVFGSLSAYPPTPVDTK